MDYVISVFHVLPVTNLRSGGLVTVVDGSLAT
jgi:hypothetical protein